MAFFRHILRCSYFMSWSSHVNKANSAADQCCTVTFDASLSLSFLSLKFNKLFCVVFFLAVKERQLKITVRYHSFPSDWQ